jgi:hypothetical protein
MTIDPVNVVCPHCGLKSSHYIIMSGTIFHSEVYTDGRRDVLSGMHGTNPYLIRCRDCRGFYFYQENTFPVDRRLPDLKFDNLHFEEHHLLAADYSDCLKELTSRDNEQETNIRLFFWRAYNDIIRWKSDDERLKEHARLREEMKLNLTRLQKIIGQDMEEEYLFPLVEICRELGQFEKARKYLNMIPEGRNSAFLELQENLIASGDTTVHKIPS